MSTRSQVKIIGENVVLNLYHHCDGYPEGVGFDLMDRFYNDMLKMKELGRKLWFDDVANRIVKDPDDRYEITGVEHGDIEYEYIVDLVKNEIRCFEIEHIWSEKPQGGFDCQLERNEIDLVLRWKAAGARKDA